jgi:hypothetical protein
VGAGAGMGSAVGWIPRPRPGGDAALPKDTCRGVSSPLPASAPAATAVATSEAAAAFAASSSLKTATAAGGAAAAAAASGAAAAAGSVAVARAAVHPTRHCARARRRRGSPPHRPVAKRLHPLRNYHLPRRTTPRATHPARLPARHPAAGPTSPACCLQCQNLHEAKRFIKAHYPSKNQLKDKCINSKPD